MSKINDPAPRSGRYVGDLKYGRMNGRTLVKHEDFTGEENQPIVPLVLVEPRDTQVWKRDPYLKERRKDHSNHQSIKSVYLENLNHLRSNIHLTIGRNRL